MRNHSHRWGDQLDQADMRADEVSYLPEIDEDGRVNHLFVNDEDFMKKDDRLKFRREKRREKRNRRWAG